MEVLTRVNTTEFLNSVGLAWVKWGKRWLEALCRPAARQISVDMARFDQLFATLSLRCASSALLAELLAELNVRDSERVPPSGPLLIVANHPGLCDVLTVLATVARDDVKVVAADYPLLHALSGINRHFVFVPRRPDMRRAALNRIIAYLQGGGAVLMLPAGQIEPDPALSSDALAALNAWSPSIGLIARKVENLSIVPAVVSGVLLGRFQHHPLTLIRRRTADRQQLGRTLQVLARATRATNVQVAYGQPLDARELRDRDITARAITHTVIEQARALMLAELSRRVD